MEALHAQADRRVRLVSKIRGWLHKERSPRLTVLLLLIATAASVVAINSGMRSFGFYLPPMRWAIAIIGSWPVFVVLLRWRASVEWQRLHLDRFGEEYARHDELVEEALHAPLSPVRQRRGEAMWRGFHSGVNSGMQRAGGAGLPVLILITTITLGSWALWQLIRNGPTILANIIIDSEAVPLRPVLATKISREPWFFGALGETGVYFFALACAAFLLGLSLPFFIHLHR